MNAKEMLEAGKLSDAIKRLNEDLRAHPADPSSRTILFEALCFTGEYDRARRQLDALGQLDANLELGLDFYRDTLTAEQTRLAVRTEDRLPVFLLEPPPFVSLYLAALRRFRENNVAEARALLAQAIEEQPVISAKIDGTPCADFADADPFSGAIIEALVGPRYVWVPFAQIVRVSIEPPQRLRDTLWAKASLETVDSISRDVLLPVLYCGSFRHPDEQVRLGRATDWTDAGENLVLGSGQRTFLLDDDEKAILELREVEFASLPEI